MVVPGPVILINPNDGTAVADQIQRNIRYLVALGALRHGERLPTVAELAEQIGCARALVSRAYEVLKIEGVIVGVVGHGSYIADDARNEDLLRRVASGKFSEAMATAKTLGCTRDDIAHIMAEQLENWYPSVPTRRKTKK